jgi:hypothetical protein
VAGGSANVVRTAEGASVSGQCTVALRPLPPKGSRRREATASPCSRRRTPGRPQGWWSTVGSWAEPIGREERVTMSTAATARPHAVTGSSARRLLTALAVLVLVDAVGGVLAVATDVNTWSQAWGPQALLAAPLPMIAGQVLLAVLATRTSRRWGAVPAAVLALACLVSIVSGFFDGGLGNDRLTAGHAAYQLLLLAVTGLVGVLAAVRARVLLTRPDDGVASAT